MDFKMKKTLAALAVLGAFAGSAMAADVTLYGALDTGFEYIHTKNPGEKAVDTFDMQTGWDTHFIAPKELAMPEEYKLYCKEHNIKYVEHEDFNEDVIAGDRKSVV